MVHIVYRNQVILREEIFMQKTVNILHIHNDLYFGRFFYFFISSSACNYSGTALAPPAAACEKEGNGARTPRAPAG